MNSNDKAKKSEKPNTQTQTPATEANSLERPTGSTGSLSASGHSLASSPLVVTLLIILLAAVFIQGALLIGLYSKSKSENSDTDSDSAQSPELVAKIDDPDLASAAPSSTPSLPKPLTPSPLQSSPLGSLPTDDFFSDDWQPFAEMSRMREQMDKLFDDSFGRFRTMPGFDEDWLNMGSAFSGEANIDEKDGNYIVSLEIPGADEATLDIKLEDGVLSVSGTREELKEERGENDQLLSRSQSTSTFQRSFSLPAEAEPGGMTSDYKDDVLTITIPKKK